METWDNSALQSQDEGIKTGLRQRVLQRWVGGEFVAKGALKVGSDTSRAREKGKCGNEFYLGGAGR